MSSALSTTEPFGWRMTGAAETKNDWHINNNTKAKAMMKAKELGRRRDPGREIVVIVAVTVFVDAMLGLAFGDVRMFETSVWVSLGKLMAFEMRRLAGISRHKCLENPVDTRSFE
jgi:hypothetical protein